MNCFIIKKQEDCTESDVFMFFVSSHHRICTAAASLFGRDNMSYERCENVPVMVQYLVVVLWHG